MKSIAGILGFAIFASAAHGAGVTGRTADGCSYRILNGQYLTDCSAKKKKEEAPPADAQAEGTPAASAEVVSEPIGSYGDVPVRQNPYAPIPSTIQVEAAPTAPPIPNTVRVPLRAAPGSSAMALTAYESTIRDFEETRRQRRIDRAVERPYVGVLAGATTISNTETGSATGVGLTVGTLLDEYFGVELGYSYAKQGLNLGLPGPTGGLLAAPGADDASLSAHLFTLEAQGYITSAIRPFRPFLGLGLGFKSSQLTELARENSVGNYAGRDSTLSQTSVGGSASAGAKLRVAKDISLSLAFRYFFPFARQGARLEQPAPSYGIPTLTSETS
ncbi:MAG: porin family protein, partial [Proteobacteria bacterium]